jgi:RNA polymerase sigma-70 factor, ECF subfamily
MIEQWGVWRKFVTDPNVNPIESGNSTSLGLLERVKAKDAAAWEQMVNLYTPLVDHWSLKAGLQEADAADVRQEVFLAVARKVEDFHRHQAGDTFRGWLRRIAQNKVRDHWRKTRGNPMTGSAEAQEQLEQMAAPADGSEESVAEETKILYRRALELMRQDFEERRWQAFWRVVMDGREPRDVAAELQMTTNAVYLAKARVLARLREEFAGTIES